MSDAPDKPKRIRPTKAQHVANLVAKAEAARAEMSKRIALAKSEKAQRIKATAAGLQRVIKEMPDSDSVRKGYLTGAGEMLMMLLQEELDKPS